MRHGRLAAARVAGGTVAVALAGAELAAQHHAAGGSAPDAELHRQLEQVRRATAAFQDVRAAERSGYRLGPRALDAPLMGEHWMNPLVARQPLDLARPAVLQYVRVGERRVLVGVAYARYQRPGDPMPEGFAGSGDHWHVHDLQGLAEVLRGSGSARGARTARGRLRADAARTGLAMLHAWVWSPNPDGVFADQNRALPYLRAGLRQPPAGREGGARAWAAARGVDLLAPGGCRRAAEAAERLLRTTPAQQREMAIACRDARVRLRAAAAGGDRGPPEAEAAAAFARFRRATWVALTPEQRALARERAPRAGAAPGAGHRHAPP